MSHSSKQFFLKQITIYFNQETCNSLQMYFDDQYFDEWDDIKEDISGGYDDCCSKELFTSQKRKQYNKLKQCLQRTIQTSTSIMTTPFNKTHQNIINAFTKSHNKQFANTILTLFKSVVQDEEFDDMDAVVDDMDEIESSEIIPYIVKQLSIHHQQYNINSIPKILQNVICGKQTLKYEITSTDDNHDIGYIAKIKYAINRVFTARFNNQVTTIILNAFDEVIKESGFYYESLVDDIADTDDSELFEKIFQNIDNLIDQNGGKNDRNFIINTIKEIIRSQGQKTFNCKKFVFNINQADIDYTTQLLKKQCSTLYKHTTPVDINKLNDISAGIDDNKQEERMDLSLIIAKSIDIKNNKPILLWLVNMYYLEVAKYYRIVFGIIVVNDNIFNITLFTRYCTSDMLKIRKKICGKPLILIMIYSCNYIQILS